MMSVPVRALAERSSWPLSRLTSALTFLLQALITTQAALAAEAHVYPVQGNRDYRRKARAAYP